MEKRVFVAYFQAENAGELRVKLYLPVIADIVPGDALVRTESVSRAQKIGLLPDNE